MTERNLVNLFEEIDLATARDLKRQMEFMPVTLSSIAWEMHFSPKPLDPMRAFALQLPERLQELLQELCGEIMLNRIFPPTVILFECGEKAHIALCHQGFAMQVLATARQQTPEAALSMIQQLRRQAVAGY